MDDNEPTGRDGAFANAAAGPQPLPAAPPGEWDPGPRSRNDGAGCVLVALGLGIWAAAWLYASALGMAAGMSSNPSQDVAGGAEILVLLVGGPILGIALIAAGVRHARAGR
jgi:hypothetical protein